MLEQSVNLLHYVGLVC